MKDVADFIQVQTLTSQGHSTLEAYVKGLLAE